MMRHAKAVQTICACDAKAKTSDPTGTGDIRRRYKSAVEMRWRKMRAQLRMCVVDQDFLGLDGRIQTPLSIAMQAMPQDSKLVAFQNWLDKTLSDVVLETDTAYLDAGIAMAYNRAVARSLRLAKVYNKPPQQQANTHTLQQFALTEMQGICEAVSQQIVRTAANGILDAVRPVEVFNAAAAVIDKIGITRSRALIETIIVKAHNTGSLDTFEANGVNKVSPVPESLPGLKRDAAFVRDAKRKTGAGSKSSRTKTPSKSTIARIRREQRELERRLSEVEILTAGDNEVCPVCEAIAENGPYSINTARSLIPAHPNCRCAWVPADDDRFAPIIEKEDDD